MQAGMERTIGAMKKGSAAQMCSDAQYLIGKNNQMKYLSTHDIMVYRYVSTSMHAQVDRAGGKQASHLIH